MARHLQNFRKFVALAVAVLAISLSTNAQTWYIMGKFMGSPPEPQGKTLEVHQQSGTVDISGVTYNTIKIVDYSHLPVKETIDSLVGAYRTDGNQVYFCKWNGTAYADEVLLYDYDLEEGDFFNDLDEHPMMVTEVSTIIDNDGVERKKFSFVFEGLPDETEYWIEGIGSSRGFIFSGQYQLTQEKAKFHLLCYHVEDDLIYVNPEYDACDIDDIEEYSVDNSLNIYPNPASSIVKILNDNNLNITNIEIIDLTGRTVLNIENTTDIDISNLPEGQYFVKIYGESTIVKKLSVVK